MRKLLRIYQSSIRYTIIGPYLVLMLLVMLVGSSIATTLVADSWQERFNNQLSQVSRNFAEAFANREIGNIDFLGLITFTAPNAQTGAPSVGDALKSRDVQGLELALQGLWQLGRGTANVKQDRLIVFDTTGTAVFDWEYNPANPTEPTRYIGTSLAGVPLVDRVLRAESDDIGDKYSGLISFRTAAGQEQLHFFTVAPFYLDSATGTGTLVGGLLIAQRLDTLLADLQLRSQTAISTIFDISGRALATTVEISGGGSVAVYQPFPAGISEAPLSEPIVQTPQQDNRPSSAATLPIFSVEAGAPTKPLQASPHSQVEPALLSMSAELLAQLRSADLSSGNMNQGAPEPCVDIGNLSDRLVLPFGPKAIPNCAVISTIDLGGRGFQVIYAPLLIRGVMAGYYSVGLSRDFLTSAYADTRWAVLGVTTAIALGAIIVGVQTARSINHPLSKLVQTAEAVTAGDLQRRSAIKEQNEFGMLASSFDRMTESLTAALAEVQAESTKRATIVESLSDGVIVSNREDQVELINRAGRALLGLAAEEPMPRNMSEIALEPLAVAPPSITPALLPHLFRLNGRIVRTSTTAIHDAAGTRTGTVILIHDMSDEIAAEVRVTTLTQANEVIYRALARGLAIDSLVAIAGYTSPVLSPEIALQMPKGFDLALVAFEQVSASVREYQLTTAPALQRNLVLQATEKLQEAASIAQDLDDPFRALLMLLVERWRPIIAAEGGRLARAEMSGPIPNPYVAGNPVRGTLFVGREDIMRRLQELWENEAQRPSVILYGHRRMGKSSILRNLSEWLSSDTIIIDFNLQRIGLVENTSDLLFALALAIFDALPTGVREALGEPEEDRFFERSPYTAFDQFMRSMNTARSGLRVVVAVDEFEKLEEFIAAGRLEPQLLDTLRGLIQTYPWFVLALAGLHTLEEMTHDYWNPLFGSVTRIPISFLSQEGARRLVTQPSPDFSLNYDFEAVSSIVSLTNGQPYLVQMIGHALVTRFNRQTFEEGVERERRFTKEDVQDIINTPEFYRDGHAYFEGVWSQALQSKPVGQADILTALASRPEGMSKAVIVQRVALDEAQAQLALATLVAHDVIWFCQEDVQYRFTVELMRRWVQQEQLLSGVV